MNEFFVEVLKIEINGTFSVSEIIAIAIGAILVLIILAALKKPIFRFLDRVTPGRKKTIFSHRKNQYKTRIGKKSKGEKHK